MCNHTILVTDSDTAVVDCIAEVLAFEGYQVYCHPGEQLTIDIVEQIRPDLLIVEQPRADPDFTLLLLDQLRQRDATRSIGVIVSGTDWRLLSELAAPLHERGCGTLQKPFDLDQLLDSVAGALGRGGWKRLCAHELEQPYA